MSRAGVFSLPLFVCLLSCSLYSSSDRDYFNTNGRAGAPTPTPTPAKKPTRTACRFVTAQAENFTITSDEDFDHAMITRLTPEGQTVACEIDFSRVLGLSAESLLELSQSEVESYAESPSAN